MKKKLQKMSAILLTFSMLLSLFSATAFAEETIEPSLYGCGKQLHTHDGACYRKDLDCEETLDLTCTIPVHEHKDACYHVHSIAESCYPLDCSKQYDCDEQYDCSKQYDCDTQYDCTQEHEQHTEACEHVHTDACGHVHTDSCAHIHTTACEHLHSDSCYAGEPSCTTSTADPACGMEEHAHIETCYVAHEHNDDCPHVDVLACGIEEHQTHDRACLTDDAKAAVKAVEDILAQFPSLQEMKDKRTAYDTGNTKETAAVDQAAYMAYLDAAFAAREQHLADAQAAYDALSPELKSMLSDEDKAKLATQLPDLWNELSKKVTAGEGAYTWQYTGNRYEYSLHLNNAYNWSAGAWGTGMFMLVDTDAYDGKTWMPDGPYQVNGDSNYVLAYCCDAAISIVKDTYYKRINPEDSTYFEDGSAEKIRAIVLSSYPFVPMEEMKATLKAKIDDAVLSNEEIDALTENEIIAAVQYAIWYHANEDSFKYYGPTDYGSSYKMITNGIYHDLTNSTWRWWDDNVNGDYVEDVKNYNYYADVDKGISAVKEYLLSLEGIKLDTTPDQVVINSVDIVGSTPILNGEDDTYSVALKVQLNSGGSSKKDTLKIYATSPGTGDVSEIPVIYGQKEYTLVLTAKQGEEITVTVEGTQVLPEGVYFYEPAEKGGEDVREVSQNLVGIAMGNTKIAATKKYTVSIPEEETPRTASLTLYKVSSLAEKTLSGAEFALSYVQDENTSVEIGKYPVDANGKLEISGLKAGMTYSLKETKAPAGYMAMDEVIEFTVSAEGTVQIDATNLPDDVRCETEDDEYILTVVNCPEPVSVEKVWNDSDDAAGLRPDSITVQLMKDTELEEEVILSASNGWTYTWTDLDPDHTWTVAEKDLPAGYAAMTKQEENKFTITNTYTSGGGGGGGGGSDPTPVYWTPTAEKTVDGSKTNTAGYTFEITGPNGYTETVTSDENGNVTFRKIRFDSVGVYDYTIREIAGDDETILYDASVYHVTVKIAAGPSKTVTVEKNGEVVEESAIDFNNTTVVEEIPEEETPLGSGGGRDEVIAEEDIPLADVPATGDISALWAMVATASALGLAGLNLKKRKDDEEI